MAYYHAKWARSRGGLKRRSMLRIVGETWEEMLSLARLYPEVTVINVPPRGEMSYKSKSLPIMWIDDDCRGILDLIGSVEVSDDHLLVLTWLIRKEIYNKYQGSGQDKFLDSGIRGSLRELLKHGSWVDSPSQVSLQNLNSRLEKIDLGRRSDLNFSSEQSEIGKYDRDYSWSAEAKGEDTTIPDFDRMYKQGDANARAGLRSSRPWMAGKWIDEYGE